MIKPEEYIESLKSLSREIYFWGNRIDNPTEYKFFRPSLNSVKKTYELSREEDYQDLMTAESHLTGRKINRFTHIVQSRDDLITKVKMLRLMGQKTGSCFQRCAGLDAINSVYSVTYDIDQEYNTDYHEKFLKFLVYVQDNDLVCCAAMTDPKGDRSKSPGQQDDPDLYLRVVEKNGEGIVIRGAKAHQTGALNSHEILVLPTNALKDNETEYAVMCAVPADDNNLLFIAGRQPMDLRTLDDDPHSKIDLGNPVYGGQEILIIFDDVFVPWDRVFMCGEYDFAAGLVECFASYHRQSYGGCKVGMGDTVIGAAALMAKYNGTHGKSHIKDKLVEMTYLNETLYACAIAASSEGQQLPCGCYWVDPLLANVTKLNVTNVPFQISRFAQDIAGGIIVTLPSGKDLANEHTGKFIRKYLGMEDEKKVTDKFKVLRYLEYICMGSGSIGYLTESLHGAGSPQAQRIMIQRYADFASKIEMLKDLVGIEFG